MQIKYTETDEGIGYIDYICRKCGIEMVRVSAAAPTHLKPFTPNPIKYKCPNCGRIVIFRNDPQQKKQVV